MSDDELIAKMRIAAGRLSPAELYDMLSVLGPGRPTQFDTIRFFKAVFPQLTIGLMMEASVLMILEEGADRAAFNAMLGPHLGH